MPAKGTTPKGTGHHRSQCPSLKRKNDNTAGEGNAKGKVTANAAQDNESDVKYSWMATVSDSDSENDIDFATYHQPENDDDVPELAAVSDSEDEDFLEGLNDDANSDFGESDDSD
ncbi:hypothetical protein CERSUDRAFT_96038 [Gelatoporia subvermispora B]|uniref:Uncharacterized protein n=1 Tax=Ceriporiopsis subvermispora (strain B) TaxID=914234 RepID=M2QUR6_CERS8|nr:hypothetical protein CERSUDRAFT_96038 [Gelatoporia subvermispora B]